MSPSLALLGHEVLDLRTPERHTDAQVCARSSHLPDEGQGTVKADQQLDTWF